MCGVCGVCGAQVGVWLDFCIPLKYAVMTMPMLRAGQDFLSLEFVHTWRVTSLSSIITSLVRKSAPMVALYVLSNRFCTYWFIRHVFPTLGVSGSYSGSGRGQVSGTVDREQGQGGSLPFRSNQLIDQSNRITPHRATVPMCQCAKTNHIPPYHHATLLAYPLSPRMMYLNSTFFLCAILLPLLLPIPFPATVVCPYACRSLPAAAVLWLGRGR